MMKQLASLGLVVACLAVVACGPEGRNTGDGCVGICTALGYQACASDGTFAEPVTCVGDQTCDPQAGCVVCPPEGLYCGGVSNNDIYQCNADGTGGTVVSSCPTDNVCSNGHCKTPCEAAEDHPSNVGCDFWAVDLDNETSTAGPISNDAAAEQFSIVVANNNDFPVSVTVTINAARIGEPVNEQAVVQRMVSPGVAARIDLPQREVDGAMGQNGTYVPSSGSGTFVSPHAYHVVTNGPVVVYQFNPIVQSYSNDASTLIPRQAIGSDYVVLGWNTANPCSIAGLGLASIPDHTSVTIIPIEDDTIVTIETTHPIMASGGDSGLAVAQIPKNGTATMTLGRYMVANLESDQPVDVSAQECVAAINNGQNGDFTGTRVHSNKPVVVFTSGERASGFGGATNVVYPPSWNSEEDSLCCTEHVEEQLFPLSALGKEFPIARSPIRSTDASWREPDLTRIVATVDNTTVTTNLPSPYNVITLNARQQTTFAATTGFTMSSDQPIQVGKFLVSQQFVQPGNIGDPSQLTLPAAEQYRKDYVFLVPSTFTANYMVLAKPADAQVVLDGAALDAVEFGECTTGPIGMVAGVLYDQLSCRLGEGQHTVSANKPFGLSVFGYHSVGAYSFVGGSDVKIINPIF